MADMDFKKNTVKDLLESGKDNKFLIPEYQRHYEWDESKIDNLFYDLWSFYNSNNGENYFLGTIVGFIREEEQTINEGAEEKKKKVTYNEIIDGQQRLTSLFLFLRATYTKIESMIDCPEKDYLIKRLNPALYDTEKNTGFPKFDQTHIESRVVDDEDKDTLYEILSTGKVSDKKDRYSLNYSRFLDLLDESFKEPFKIFDFINSVLDETILFVIQAPSQETAMIIFTTLNDRGMQLSDSDIFKAKIYQMLNKEKRDEFIYAWKELEKECKLIGTSLTSVFTYHMYYSMAQEENNSTTLKGLRAYYNESNGKRLSSPTLMNELSEIVYFIKHRDQNKIPKREQTSDESVIIESWTNNVQIMKQLDILNSYPNEFRNYPVIIYYMKYHNNADFETKFLSFLKKFTSELLVKYIYFPTVYKIKQDIMNLDVSINGSDRPVFEFINIDKDDLKEHLVEPHGSTIRMLLKMEAYEEQDTILPSFEIEHIHPQTWQNNYYPNESEETIKKRVGQIGNLAPLEKALNIKASNNYFDKKKEKYNKSAIIMMHTIAAKKKSDWRIDEIVERNAEVTSLLAERLSGWKNQYNQPQDNIELTEEDLRRALELKRKGQL